jgi:hypothetical protein
MNSTHLSSTALLLASTALVWLVSAASYIFTQDSWTPHIPGTFLTNGSGNAGLIKFNWGTAGIEWITLTGSFDIETVGTVTFDPGARIIGPASGLITDIWSTTGTITSPYAWTIYLNSGSTYQTNYDPVSKQLIGAGWNLGIGKVPFSTVKEWTQWFVGRIKALGSIGGTKNYSTLYAAGPAITTDKITSTINTARKKVAIMTRNLPAGLTNNNAFYGTPIPIENKVFLLNDEFLLKTFTYNDPSDLPSSMDTLVIVGGDLIIDIDILSTRPRGIIVLKNSKWLGGNIIITKNVKKIESSIIIEWSLLSGDNKNSLYNDTTEKVALLSQNVTNQLYIHGGLISYNTIGGALQSPAVCVYGEPTCTHERALKYDLNFFRWYDKNPLHRGYDTASQDDYSLVIEPDARANRAPPPGFESR